MSDNPRVLVSVDPVTGQEIGRYPIAGRSGVASALTRATTAAPTWEALGYSGRRICLLRFARTLAARLPELADLINSESGKPRAEASVEIAASIEHLVWSANHAKNVLRQRRLGSTLLRPEHVAFVRYRPYGVVGVLGPWNYPVFTPLGAIGSALAAGNTVVFKPSDLTPAVGECLAEWFAETMGEQRIFQCVHGGASTGEHLCRSGFGKIAFQGSSPVGRRVMSLCAQTLTPVVVECGGKDAMIVLRDADLVEAADSCAWAAMTNAGQTCIGIKRVYVVNEVYDAFLDLLIDRCRTLKVTGAAADLGPLLAPGQMEIIRSQLAEAANRGARVVLGGGDMIRPPYVHPTIVVDVPEDAAVMTEETFGPVVVVCRIHSAAEGIRRTNATRFGLGAAVFSRSQGMSTARELRVGMASVNGVMSFAGAGGVPFGGVGESGFGRVHGAEGLREFAWPQTIVRRRFRSPLPLMTFQRTPRTVSTMISLVRLVRGRSLSIRHRG